MEKGKDQIHINGVNQHCHMVNYHNSNHITYKKGCESSKSLDLCCIGYMTIQRAKDKRN